VNFERLLTRLSALRGSFTTAQLASLGAAFVLVVTVVVGAAYWLNTPTYRVLFSDLDPESAARVTERLRAQDVPFQLTEAGRTVLVPEPRIDELRLDFATSGLPSSGRMGFEIFDSTQFGATEFLEQVNFRRALEGEIARSIATLSEVAAARVHLSMAKDRLFGEQAQPAKASVVLKLRSNRPPAAPFVAGIASLVAAAVEGLQPESVVIIDTFGRPLARPAQDDGAPLGAAQVERQQLYEQQLAARVVSLLEPVVGEGHVRVNVAAQLHQAAEDQTEERWDPATVVRSRETTLEGSAGASAQQGVAGTRANLPGPVPPGSNEPNPPTLAQASTSPTVTNPLRTMQRENFEISRTTRHTVRPSGGVARLSVAVLVDDEQVTEKDGSGNSVSKTRPRDPAQLQKLHQLVTSAVGLDTTRGDLLTVENIAFNEPAAEVVPEPGVLQRVGTHVPDAVRLLVVLGLGVLAFFLIGRPLVQRVIEVRPLDDASMPRRLPRTVEELEGEMAGQLEAGPVAADRRLPALSKRLSTLTQKEPEVAARLVRSWLLEEKK
jgi:flagellar M-ring protein FliF